MTEPTGMPWTDNYLLGYTPMDDTHREFVDVVDAMLSCSDADFPARLRAFIEHAEKHFADEKAWMQASDFPATDCHVDDHEAVLNSAHEVEPLVLDGNLEIGRSFAAELVKWFPGHADYLDSALAHWLVKKKAGGKPVVLRRNVTLAE
ncbi:hemerythrin domain-containing protein [Zoogloea sp.]|uniref:bacteriohemerythrin n=1 Tax=Zoogloea sp. TaxID=49181 RepID=UPI0014168872|nr:MAG: hemerythrin [Zoogloea sp.]